MLNGEKFHLKTACPIKIIKAMKKSLRIPAIILSVLISCDPHRVAPTNSPSTSLAASPNNPSVALPNIFSVVWQKTLGGNDADSSYFLRPDCYDGGAVIAGSSETNLNGDDASHKRIQRCLGRQDRRNWQRCVVKNFWRLWK